MALPVRQQMKYWGIAAAILFLVLWGLGTVILPFLVGGAVAYFMDPVADRLERLGLSRAAATAVISVAVLFVFILAALLVVPTLVRQLGQLVNAAPAIAGQLQTFLQTNFPQVMEHQTVLPDTLASLGEAIKARGGELASRLLSSAMSVVSAVMFIVVVPVVAFYMLLDWDKMVAEIDAWLPRDHAPVIRDLARQIDVVLAGFVRGQITVCLILGTFYAVGLMLAGLQFGLVIGAIAGLISFIPYVGTLVGGTLAMGLALFQFWGEWSWIAVIGGIFVAGQMIEGNFLTPKLVGGSVGLHPVWLLFALSAFGTLFGFAGMMAAVPVAASIGVLARFAIARYRASRLYMGLERPEDREPDLRVEVTMAPHHPHPAPGEGGA